MHPSRCCERIQRLFDESLILYAVEKGMAREVSALMGERAPPISMIPVQPKYKQRPRRSHKATPWYAMRATIITQQAHG